MVILISISIILIIFILSNWLASYTVYGPLANKHLDETLNTILEKNRNQARLNGYNSDIIRIDSSYIVISKNPIRLLSKYHIQSGFKPIRISRFQKSHKTIESIFKELKKY